MNIYNVIKYEGDNNVLVWKHPVEDFNIGSTIIVHESQEAIFFKDGKALDLFGPGKHVLDTNNLPLLNKLVNLPSNGISPFHCEVYFINKTHHMAIKWGTDNKIQYIDPIYNFPLKLGASGEMILSVDDARKLLIKLVGTEKILDNSTITTYFRAFLLSKVKNYLVSLILQEKIGIFDIDQNIIKVSDGLQKLLENDFLEYGIKLEQIFVTSFVKPEEEQEYFRLKQLHADKAMAPEEAKLHQDISIIRAETSAKEKIIDAESQAEKRKIEGYTYQEEQGYEVAKNLAQNEGIGNFTNAGIGLGMMAGVGNAFGGIINNSINDTVLNQNSVNNDNNKYCPKCGQQLPINANYCVKCGEKQ